MQADKHGGMHTSSSKAKGVRSVRIEETGKLYGALTVLAYSDTSPDREARWMCQCSCGQITVVRGSELREGRTKSCGCRRAFANQERTKHGNAKRGKATVEYRAWLRLLNRCYDKTSPDYPAYGGRGITVCERWRTSFQSFLSDMGPRPHNKSSIDRENNDGGYEPNNCRWADSAQQARNKRNNHYVMINGQRKLLKEWCAIFGISTVSVYKRIRLGMNDVEAITRRKSA